MITVKKKTASFSESDFETKSYIYENSIGGKYLYVTIKNNSEAVVSIKGNATAYDASGNMIGAKKSSIDVLGAGEQSIMVFSFSDVKNMETAECSFEYSGESYYQPVISNLVVEQTINDKNLTVKVTNNGEYNAQFVMAHALFFDADDNVVYTDSTYLVDNDSEIKVGASYTGQLNTRSDFDHVECYFSGRSDGKATKADTSITDADFEIKEYSIENSANSTYYYLVVKNNSTKDVGIKGNMTAFDAEGNTLGAANGSIDILGQGDETLMPFSFSSVSHIDHTEYQMSYDTSPYYVSVLPDLEVSQSVNDKNIIVSVTNNGKNAAEFVQVYAMFFNAEGDLIKVNSTYAVDGDHEIKPGATQIAQLDCREAFDHVECYIHGRRH